MVQNINVASCLGCGTCVEICPLDVFELNVDRGCSEIIHIEDCQTCYQCELECPGGAIHVDPYIKPKPGAWMNVN